MTTEGVHQTLKPEPFTLRDGRTINIRRMRPDDAIRLREAMKQLSPRTRRLRFFTPMRELTGPFSEQLANVDFVRRAAFVASFPGDDSVRAIGRYESTGAGSAEVAFVVSDELQGQGLGSELLHHLAVLGRANGITEFTALLLAENVDMFDILRHSGYPFRAKSDGDLVNVSMDITKPAG